MAKTEIDGPALKRLLGAGVKGVAQNVELINELNVFPVPDGDTGVNLYHTLSRAWDELEAAADCRADAVAERFAYGALMGARGNSGVIMSQLLAGFADGLGETEILSPSTLAEATVSAVKRAYAAVSQPVEGTVLTVAREAADSVHVGMSIEEMLQSLLTRAQAALDETPNQLPILKDAGVVDAGAMGLVCFLQGMYESSCGARADLTVAPPRTKAAPTSPAPVDSYGYDVQFLMLGAALDINAIRADLEQLGWSVIVAGADGVIKVHIHVENPALPLDYAVKTGAALDDIVVENMELQAAVRRQSGQAGDIGAFGGHRSGRGRRPEQPVFRDLNCAFVIDGGAGKNPATQDFVAAIDALDAGEIIILPNNRNIELAARQAADMTNGKRISIVATRTVAEGVSAMIAFGDGGDAGLASEATVEAMREAALATTTIEITRATRSTTLRGLDIRQGDWLALIDGQIRATAADIKSALLNALKLASGASKELATLYYGADLSTAAAEAIIACLAQDFPNLEYEAVYGGQALYPLIVSVE